MVIRVAASKATDIAGVSRRATVVGPEKRKKTMVLEKDNLLLFHITLALSIVKALKNLKIFNEDSQKTILKTHKSQGNGQIEENQQSLGANQRPLHLYWPKGSPHKD